MPRFRLPPHQVDDLVAYFQSLRAGEAVGPSDHTPARDTSGSGFYVGPDGHILTAAHVVRQCRRTSVETPGAQSQEAEVVAAEAGSDLALLRVGVRPSAFASLDPDVQVEVGESLAAYGFPLTGTLASAGTLSVGHVAALSGVHDNGSRFQMSVDLQPGSSGGPVLDSTGAVVGVAVTRLKSTSSASGFVPGVNFAVGGYDIQSFLARSGIVGNFDLGRAHMPLQRIAQLARSYTVRVSCRG
jgi:S1-C subfamily serine protease